MCKIVLDYQIIDVSLMAMQGTVTKSVLMFPRCYQDNYYIELLSLVLPNCFHIIDGEFTDSLKYLYQSYTQFDPNNSVGKIVFTRIG